MLTERSLSMRITESRLRRIIRSVLKEEYEFREMNPFPHSQSGSSEGDRQIVDQWLRSPKGQHWWSLASKGHDARGLEIKVTSQDLEKNPRFRGEKCMLTGRPLKPGKVVIIQEEGRYNALGYVDWAVCRKFAQDQLGYE